MKSWLQDESIKMHSAHNEKNLVVTEKVIKTLKNKIYKYLTSVLKNVYIDKLGEMLTNGKRHTISQSKRSLLMLMLVHMLILALKVMIKILDFKLAIM